MYAMIGILVLKLMNYSLRKDVLKDYLQLMIAQEIEGLIKFDVNQMNMIEKVMKDHRMKGSRTFQWEVLIGENNR
jgi:hypothetical protein